MCSWWDKALDHKDDGVRQIFPPIILSYLLPILSAYSLKVAKNEIILALDLKFKSLCLSNGDSLFFGQNHYSGLDS